MYYTTSPISSLNSLSVIENAYTAAGLKVPTIAEDVSKALTAEPDAVQVAADYTRKVIDAAEGSAAELIEQALAAVARAQAAETLRRTFYAVSDQVVAERADELRDQAVKDLTPAFKRTVKALTTAASKLDVKRPLDRDVAFDTDTTAEFKQATVTLAQLAAFVFRVTHTDPPMVGARLLPIVSIPDATPERGAGSRYTPWQSERGQEGHKERNAIRRLARDAEEDIDRAVLGVALGKYHGVTLALADTTELERRRVAFENANTRINTNRDHPALIG